MDATIVALIALVSAFLGWSLRPFLGGYLTKKGENLATKQDAEAITRTQQQIQQQIKSGFDQLIEHQRSVSQLRLAVVDRRFHAHQEAYRLWQKLMSNVHTPDCIKTVVECQAWWIDNCLYLDSKARKAFIRAYNCAAHHKDLLNDPRDEGSIRLIKENWQNITDAGPAIEAAVNLPALDISEIQPLDGPNLKAIPD